MEGPGYLRVTIQPGSSTLDAALEDWYRDEHGPLRLRLDFITSGNRYKAADDAAPQWSAEYEITDLACLEKRIYTRLREERSKREAKVMGTFDELDRKIYSLKGSSGRPVHPSPVQITESFLVSQGKEADFEEWSSQYLKSSSQSTIQSRCFKMEVAGINGMPSDAKTEYLIVHDCSEIDIARRRAALEEAKLDHSIAQAIKGQLRVWKHHWTFDALEEGPSTVMSTDGAQLRYQLEGNPADPVVVCINSILTDFHIWDDVSAALCKGINGQAYRVLRYNSRGYKQQWSGSRDTNFDILADDLEYLLSRLSISKAHAVIGVSMGGVTAINFAIRYPDLLDRFVACDCNVASSPANDKAWDDRIELAKDKGMSELAKITAERWFTPANHGSPNFAKVLRMIEPASIDGFQQNAAALCGYDLKPKLAEIKAPALLLAGDGDGKLPEVMQTFAIPKATFKAIPNAGHLPMLENGSAFEECLRDFL